MQDWDAMVKMVMAAYQKIPDVHWATYQAHVRPGRQNLGRLQPMKSASEIDQSFDQDKQFMANMGEDGMKKFSELLAATIESSQHNLFAFSSEHELRLRRMDQGRSGFLEAQGQRSGSAKKDGRKTGRTVGSRQ